MFSTAFRLWQASQTKWPASQAALLGKTLPQ